LYKADFSDIDLKKLKNMMRWHPSIHMPKEAARIFLWVTSVRSEKLKDVTESEAVAEGFSSRAEFVSAISKIYPKCSMSWFEVVEFKRLEME